MFPSLCLISGMDFLGNFYSTTSITLVLISVPEKKTAAEIFLLQIVHVACVPGGTEHAEVTKVHPYVAFCKIAA